MTVTIAEELLLLAYSEQEGKPVISAMPLDAALAGALLAELAVNERVELSKKKITVRDATPLGETELDAVLARMAEDGKERRPAWWVQKLQAGKLRNRLLSGLAERGVLSEQQRKVLGMFPASRWPEADPSVELEVRERVSSALAGGEPEPRTAVLIALLHAAKLDRKAFPGASKARIKEISEGTWAADAVAQTIAAINGAMIAAVSAAVTVSAAGSSGG